MFGLYVHIPFCVHKCSYCDFYSFTKYTRSDFELFAETLKKEIRNGAAWLKNRPAGSAPLSSIFFGGGTPSLLPVELLGELLTTIDENFEKETSCEITLEANPETVTEAFAHALSKLAFNRVSLGAQSFGAQNLKALERLGSAESIVRATQLLKESGFGNFSLDLIFGIPGQKKENILSDIESAAALGPRHLSFYNLTLKPGHALYAKLPQDDLSASWYEAGVERLADLGYRRYEISNFARAGFESQHNLLYWDGGEYLGVGPSAASRIFEGGNFFHRKQISEFSKYLEVGSKELSWADWEGSTREQTILEATFLELRKKEGIRLSRFEFKYGYDLCSADKFSAFLKNGFLEQEGDTLRLTDKGFLLADTVTAELAP